MSGLPAIRAVLVDDEPLARRRLRALLASEPDVEIVGEAGNATTAIELILTTKPDLVFLDVQMPGQDGFGVVRAVSATLSPLIIFVTAFDEHAIRAFEVAAIDYLLKPVIEGRFRAAVRRAVERVRVEPQASLTRQLAQLLERVPAMPQVDRLPVRSGNGGVTFVRVHDIDWVEVTGDQLTLHVGKVQRRVRETMAQMELRLLPPQFVRIHRSTIVNVERIREIQPWFKGDYVLLLVDGTKLTSGRTYRERVQALLK